MNIRNNKVEILSPAGSFETFLAAVNAGADAIYMGGDMFGARAYSQNFSETELLKAIDIAHLHNRKIYLTVNTLLKENEMQESLYRFLKPYYEQGLDAVIVQDIGVLGFIKRYFPGLDIHASTQMTLTGAYGAELLQEMGASRIVASRELNLDEIRNISQNVSVEIESFVHGALCYCYSGQCFMSSLIGGRSGNRGRCAQPCRLPYSVISDHIVKNNEIGKYVLSPKDLCGISLLPQIIGAGVYSLKIEGRMKSKEYTAGVVSIYKKYANMFLEDGAEGYKIDEKDLIALKDLFNRGDFTKGYYVGHTGPDMMALDRPNHRGVAALKVIGKQNAKTICKTLVLVNPKDIFEIAPDFSYTSGIQAAPGTQMTLNIPAKYSLKQGDIIYRVKNNELAVAINENIIEKNATEGLRGKLDLHIEQETAFEVSLLDREGEIRQTVITSEKLGEKAENQPTNPERIKKQLEKTGGTPFYFEELSIESEEGVFVPIQKLNELRRRTLEQLEREVISSYRRKVQDNRPFDSGSLLVKDKSCFDGKVSDEVSLNLYLSDSHYLKTALSFAEVKSVYLEMEEYTSIEKLESDIWQCKEAGKKVYLSMPRILRTKAVQYFDKYMETILGFKPDAFLVKSFDEIQYLRNYVIRKPDSEIISLILDYHVYTFNKYAKAELKALEIKGRLRIIFDTAPIELNDKELNRLGIEQSELLVYGYLPMMVTAQCVKKTVLQCDKKYLELYIRDRKNKDFRVKNNCNFCYNTIYNSSPLYLLDKYNEIEKLSPQSVRIVLTNEEEAVAKNLIADSIQVFIKRKNTMRKLEDYTRGHFLRGVE